MLWDRGYTVDASDLSMQLAEFKDSYGERELSVNNFNYPCTKMSAWW